MEIDPLELLLNIYPVNIMGCIDYELRTKIMLKVCYLARIGTRVPHCEGLCQHLYLPRAALCKVEQIPHEVQCLMST